MKYKSFKDIQNVCYFNYYSLPPVFNKRNHCPMCNENIFSIDFFYKSNTSVRYHLSNFEVGLCCYFCKFAYTITIGEDYPYFSRIKQLHI